VAEVVAFFHRRVFDSELALDLTAETFAGALASVRGFSADAGEPRAWLFAIARHKLADAIRQRRVEDRVRRALAMQPVVLDDEGLAIIERIAARGVLELVDGLPEPQREAIVAHYVDGRPYEEIAAALQLSESVVRKRVSRGLRALRRAIMGRAGS
jgi:RNA polymerase sigma-70 factor (ECF subfamily)